MCRLRLSVAVRGINLFIRSRVPKSGRPAASHAMGAERAREICGADYHSERFRTNGSKKSAKSDSATTGAAGLGCRPRPAATR